VVDDLATATAADAAAAVRLVGPALDRAIAGIEPVPRHKDAPTTSGHFFRGVL